MNPDQQQQMVEETMSTFSMIAWVVSAVTTVTLLYVLWSMLVIYMLS